MMEWAPDAYADGISKTAAGSEIEVFASTVARTTMLLRAHAEDLAGGIAGNGLHEADDQWYRDEIEYVESIMARWNTLWQKIVDHPNNQELAFNQRTGNEEREARERWGK